MGEEVETHTVTAITMKTIIRRVRVRVMMMMMMVGMIIGMTTFYNLHLAHIALS